MRKVFFSFDWDDVWRVNQVRNSWVAKGSYAKAGFVDKADIEVLKKKDQAIKRWIDEQMHGTSVTCVLIGNQTADSKWVKYEIQQSIDDRKGLVGIYIKDQSQHCSDKGDSPFARSPFNYFRPTDNPDYPCVSYYDWIQDDGYKNLGSWIEKAARQAGRQ